MTMPNAVPDISVLRLTSVHTRQRLHLSDGTFRGRSRLRWLRFSDLHITADSESIDIFRDTSRNIVDLRFRNMSNMDTMLRLLQNSEWPMLYEFVIEPSDVESALNLNFFQIFPALEVLELAVPLEKVTGGGCGSNVTFKSLRLHGLHSELASAAPDIRGLSRLEHLTLQVNGDTLERWHLPQYAKLRSLSLHGPDLKYINIGVLQGALDLDASLLSISIISNANLNCVVNVMLFGDALTGKNIACNCSDPQFVDVSHCPKAEAYQCRDGSTIPITKVCDGTSNCDIR